MHGKCGLMVWNTSRHVVQNVYETKCWNLKHLKRFTIMMHKSKKLIIMFSRSLCDA